MHKWDEDDKLKAGIKQFISILGQKIIYKKKAESIEEIKYIIESKGIFQQKKQNCKLKKTTGTIGALVYFFHPC